MIDLGDCAIVDKLKQDIRVVGESQTKGSTGMLDRTRNSLRSKLSLKNNKFLNPWMARVNGNTYDQVWRRQLRLAR